MLLLVCLPNSVCCVSGHWEAKTGIAQLAWNWCCTFLCVVWSPTSREKLLSLYFRKYSGREGLVQPWASRCLCCFAKKIKSMILVYKTQMWHRSKPVFTLLWERGSGSSLEWRKEGTKLNDVTKLLVFPVCKCRTSNYNYPTSLVLISSWEKRNYKKRRHLRIWFTSSS